MALFNKKNKNTKMLIETIELNHSSYLNEDNSYWGDVAISFKNGDHLLLPVTIIQMEHLHFQMQSIHPGKFLHLVSLDNRAIYFNYSQVADIYTSSENHDIIGPEGETADYIPPTGLTKIWEVLFSYFFEEDDLNALSAEKRNILRSFIGDKDHQRFITRLNEINWRFISGKSHTTAIDDDKDTFNQFMNMLNYNHHGDDFIELKLPDGPRCIFISPSALNYIWFPWHKVVNYIIENSETKSK